MKKSYNILSYFLFICCRGLISYYYVLSIKFEDDEYVPPPSGILRGGMEARLPSIKRNMKF